MHHGDRKHQREGDLNSEAARFDIGEFASVLLGRAQLRDHARVEHARGIEIHVVIAMQLDGSRHMIAFRNERDLRLRLRDLTEQLCRRQHDGLVHLDVGTLHGRPIGMNDHRSRKATRGRLSGA